MLLAVVQVTLNSINKNLGDEFGIFLLLTANIWPEDDDRSDRG
jgi:hypothetical protein